MPPQPRDTLQSQRALRTRTRALHPQSMWTAPLHPRPAPLSVWTAKHQGPTTHPTLPRKHLDIQTATLWRDRIRTTVDPTRTITHILVLNKWLRFLYTAMVPTRTLFLRISLTLLHTFLATLVVQESSILTTLPTSVATMSKDLPRTAMLRPSQWALPIRLLVPLYITPIILCITTLPVHPSLPHL